MLHQCGKRGKTKSQNILKADSYVCRRYRRKTGRGEGFLPLPPILNRVKKLKNAIYKLKQVNTRFIMPKLFALFKIY